MVNEKQCQHPVCKTIFQPVRSTAKFCPEHRGGNAAKARFREKLKKLPCSRCGVECIERSRISDDKTYCLPCYRQLQRERIQEERRRSIERELPGDWKGIVNAPDPNKFIEDRLESLEAIQESFSGKSLLEHLGTALLIRGKTKFDTDYPVQKVDSSYGDALDRINPSAEVVSLIPGSSAVVIQQEEAA